MPRFPPSRGPGTGRTHTRSRTGAYRRQTEDEGIFWAAQPFVPSGSWQARGAHGDARGPRDGGTEPREVSRDTGASRTWTENITQPGGTRQWGVPQFPQASPVWRDASPGPRAVRHYNKNEKGLGGPARGERAATGPAQPASEPPSLGTPGDAGRSLHGTKPSSGQGGGVHSQGTMG